MKKAAALVHQYVPPKPDLIDKAKAAGKLALRPESAGQVGVDFTDYLKPGDAIKARCHQLRDGSNGCLLGFLKGPDGVVKDWDGGTGPVPSL